MTQAQVKKLETIIGKIESLQNEIVFNEEKDRLQSAKNELLRLLSRIAPR